MADRLRCSPTSLTSPPGQGRFSPSTTLAETSMNWQNWNWNAVYGTRTQPTRTTSLAASKSNVLNSGRLLEAIKKKNFRTIHSQRTTTSSSTTKQKALPPKINLQMKEVVAQESALLCRFGLWYVSSH